jgi:hypothetical protein
VNRSRMVVANVQYKRPTADDAKRNKALLRYLTYRDGRYGDVIQDVGMDRWEDHGLGRSIKEIAAQLDDYRSQHVLAFTLVFNPNPELTAMVPVAQREAFVRELTEQSLARFFEERGIEGGIEHAYVLHHRESESKQSPGLHDPHTHVILPGTYYDEDKGERSPLYFSRNKGVNHIEMLHRAAESTLSDLMDRYVGLEWEQTYDDIEAIREIERSIVEREPHTVAVDEHGRHWEAWIGTRCTDLERTSVGYYRYYPKDSRSEQPTFEADEVDLEFRPFSFNLTHGQAERLVNTLYKFLEEQPSELEHIAAMVEHFDTMPEAERTAIFNYTPEVEREPEPEQEVKPTRSWSFDLDL